MYKLRNESNGWGEKGAGTRMRNTVDVTVIQVVQVEFSKKKRVCMCI